ncbi:ankyrin repeat domain-containing protein SOWAHC isoform X4 [Paralichthys olivaceus]|uniref:ankyrin repeat domain-containing protein SOWAHC isoform X4 n=1 Tax=Paralichthys olivaceus TaxID=8255 RepID=UPI003751B845
MEEDFHSPVNVDILRSDVTQDEQDSHPVPGLDRVSQDQPSQNRESLTKLHNPLSPRCDLEVKGQTECRPDSSDGPEGGGHLTESDLSPVNLLDQSGPDPNRASPQDGEHQVVHHSHRDLTTAAANQDGAGESCGSIPALVVTQADECPAPGAVVGPPLSPAPSEPQRAARPAHQVAPENLFTDLCSSSDGGDMTCCDLLSLRSDSVSLGSETSVSRRSEDDDTRSVTASSVTSLFHRVQLDPLEKAWLRSSALGNMAAQRQLLAQEPGLVVKKTALHWAAKQGRQEVVDMMLRSGADVNVRSGHTALHLAAIHGHQHVIHALVNTYNAKTSVRDYHGKTALHYWSGCSDVFASAESQSGERFSRGRRTQRYVLPSLLLTRSRSQGQINLEFGAGPQSSIYDMLDLHV